MVIARKRIHYLCEGGIEKSDPRDHGLTSLGKTRLMMPNGDLGAAFFIPPSHSG